MWHRWSFLLFLMFSPWYPARHSSMVFLPPHRPSSVYFAVSPSSPWCLHCGVSQSLALDVFSSLRLCRWCYPTSWLSMTFKLDESQRYVFRLNLSPEPCIRTSNGLFDISSGRATGISLILLTPMASPCHQPTLLALPSNWIQCRTS